MRKFLQSPIRLGLFIFSALFLGCTNPSSQLAQKTIVQVNEQTLTAKEFANRLARKLKSYDALAAKDPNNVIRAKEEIIRTFILQALAVDYAKKEKLEITEKALEEEVNSFRSSYPDDLSFRRALAEEGISLADWKAEMRTRLLERMIFKKMSAKVEGPKPNEIETYFQENKERYRLKERVYLRQIITDELSKAEAIKDELRKKDFSEVAKQSSVSPEAKNGGLIGWIEKGTVDIFDKAFSLPVGGVSGVLESPYGFHIFKVERKAPAGFASLEEVRPLIVQFLMGKKEQALFASWLDAQIRSARVLRDQSMINAVTVETRGVK